MKAAADVEVRMLAGVRSGLRTYEMAEVSVRFSVRDPQAVTVVWEVGGVGVEHIMSRLWLRDGLYAPVLGTLVHVYPSFHVRNEIVVSFVTGPSSSVSLALKADLVRSLLDRAARLVPEGCESFDVDDLLVKLGVA